MRKTLDECVCCGLPCLGSSCPYAHVTRYYCDECGREADIYEFDDKELCKECIKELLTEEEYEELDFSELILVNEKEW
jgi:hypothetical protein